MIDAASVGRFGLLLVRPGVFVVATPVFGGAYVPAAVRIGLTVLLGLAMMPAVPAPDRGGPVGLVVTVAGEAAVGLALAMSVRLMVAAAEFAGHVAAFQLGLSYGAMVDPQSGVRNNLLAVLYANLALITFFGINGHHALIRALSDSYATVPIGTAGISGPFGAIVAEMLGFVFVVGLRVAAPVVATVLLVEVALGLMARAAPALNLMVVGAPLRLLAGLAALAAALHVVPSVLGSSAGPMLDAALRLVQVLR